MSMAISSSEPSVLSGGMMIQADKTRPSKGGTLVEPTPLSQIGTQPHIKQMQSSGMLMQAPSLNDIAGSKKSVDLYA